MYSIIATYILQILRIKTLNFYSNQQIIPTYHEFFAKSGYLVGKVVKHLVQNVHKNIQFEFAMLKYFPAKNLDRALGRKLICIHLDCFSVCQVLGLKINIIFGETLVYIH